MKASVPVDGPLDLERTLHPLLNGGRRDPSLRIRSRRHVEWALHAPTGPVSLDVRHEGDVVEAKAWGPGAPWALERLGDLVGLGDDPTAFEPEHPVVREWVKQQRGMRLPRIARPSILILPAILYQLVPGPEAGRAWLRLVRDHGTDAPGELGLRLPPSPEELRRIQRSRLIAAGALGKQATTMLEVARCAKRLDEAADMPDAMDVARRLTAVPGVGPWTAGSVMLRGLGFADAVPIGDYHLPNGVAWTFAGEARADDNRMLELLEPFRPHRGRVVRLMMGAGVHAPKFGPRQPLRRLDTR